MTAPLSPQDAARWDAVEEATELLREGDSESARRELSAALDRDPRNQYAHYFLAGLLFEKGEFDASRVHYGKAVESAPDYLGAVVGLGHALRMLGRHEQAIREGERALLMSGAGTNDADAHYLLGLAHAERGDTNKAIRHLEAFLATNPEVEVRHDVDAMLQVLRGKAKPLEPV